MPEWSKGADLSSAIERCVGSNPTGCIFISRSVKERVRRGKRKGKRKRKGKKQEGGVKA